MGAANSRYEWLGRGGISRGTGWPVTWHASNLASCILQGIQQRSGGYGGALVEPLFVFPSCWQSKFLECEGAFKVSTARVLPGSAFKFKPLTRSRQHVQFAVISSSDYEQRQFTVSRRVCVLSPGHSGGCQLHAWPVRGCSGCSGREAARAREAQSCGSCRQGPGVQELLRCNGHGCCQRNLLGAPPPQLPLGTVGRGSSIRRRCCSSGPTAGTGDHADATAAEAVLVATVGVSDAPDNDVKRKVSSSPQGEHMPA